VQHNGDAGGLDDIESARDRERANSRSGYIGSFRPMNFQSRDMGLFKDDDGSAYLLTEDVSTRFASGTLFPGIRFLTG
jgi:hypothetical protein